jgi:hypothetical protein
MPAGSTYSTIATTTLGSAQASYTFSSIPSTYTDLVLIAQTSITSGAQQNKLVFNGDTGNNFSATFLTANGSTAGSGNQTNNSSMLMGYDDYNTTAIGQMTIFHIMNYANTTTFKTVLARGSNSNTGVSASVGLWRATTAINSVSIRTSAGANYAAGTTFTLYGIAAA